MRDAAIEQTCRESDSAALLGTQSLGKQGRAHQPYVVSVLRLMHACEVTAKSQNSGTVFLAL